MTFRDLPNTLRLSQYSLLSPMSSEGSIHWNWEISLLTDKGCVCSPSILYGLQLHITMNK